jgi:hypothetical protein
MDLIVILERTSVNPPAVRYVMRATVPAARQAYYADATKTSAFPGISGGDLADFRAGKFLEKTDTVDIGGLALNDVAAQLQAAQSVFQARVNEDGLFNPFKYYGTTWSGTAWTMRGVN